VFDDDASRDGPVHLGVALRALRRRRDLSQRQLAALAGMPVSMVARIESGEVTNPSFRTVERLARATGGGVYIGSAGQAAAPIPHERHTDGGGRHFPAHLDVRMTFPFAGRDRRPLPPGTGEFAYYLDRDKRDETRAQRAPVEGLVIKRSDRPAGAGWLWVARTETGSVVGRLGAVPLPREWHDLDPAPGAVVCGLEIGPDWRDRGLEQRLLARLRAELAASGGYSELVTLTYRGPDAQHLCGLGFHTRVRTVSLLTAPAIGWEA
jgi:transcriptional regulator with XRE-family HTH domain